MNKRCLSPIVSRKSRGVSRAKKAIRYTVPRLLPFYGVGHFKFVVNISEFVFS